MHVPSTPDRPEQHEAAEILTGPGRGSRRGAGRGRASAPKGRRGLAMAAASAAAVLLVGGVAAYTFASSGDEGGSVSVPQSPGTGKDERQETAGEDGAPAGEDQDRNAAGGPEEDASGAPEEDASGGSSGGSGGSSGDSSAGSAGSGSGGSTASTSGGDSGTSRAKPSTPAREQQSGTPSQQGEEGYTDPRSDGAPGFVAPQGPTG
ncbi:hypothetical protein [Planomonospora parontospora]|uniref:hypothetical protein n=1 Tax=Planomonospora parontospora TaxID=58119 RepID=UPI00166F94A5|nr:hypothetical protein [Planomonospora parontospora]GGL22499.1 hypothetical protein GCM10014719_25630 [Planomonospora parontospora subsp. antibiotica]GII15660.1 hypothetical protein Ppa05_23860 [Planomonospora parontospora subsp. antibiotica]